MKIDRAGFPFIVAAMIPALGLLVAGRPGGALLCAVVGLCFMFFFRDPDRQIPAGERLVLSPADGRVLVAGHATDAEAPIGKWLQVSIFLSPLDVHINRVPVSGRVGRIEHRPGRFLPAYKPEASANERTEFSIDAHGQTIIVRQIVGVLARRVVCRLAEGGLVSAGDRFGLMKFGSRMDVFLPPTVELRVRVGDRVRGGESVLAVLKT